MKHLIISSFIIALLVCSCNNGKTTENPVENANTPEMKEAAKITAEMAYEGVNNYCHREYDWSAAEGNPSMMYVKMGEETESEYKVIFRSYTGAFVYFYVDKASGSTRMVESVPTLNVESEVGTINLFDYLEGKAIVWENPATEFGTSYGDGFFNLALDVTKVELKVDETVVYTTCKCLNS